MKIRRNDPCPCGSGEKYKKCCLNKQRSSIAQEELPLYRVLISDTKGSRAIVIARERRDGNLQFISVLVDEWKMGLKDCFGGGSISKKGFDAVIRRAPKDFINADLNECKWIIKQGLRIAEAVGTRIPREFYELKGIIGGMDNIQITGSLYKCYGCGKGELSDVAVDYIKKVTCHDIALGVCGTPDETRIVVVCDECKKKNTSDDELNEELEEETDEDYDEEYETRKKYLEEVEGSLRELSMSEYDEILKKAGWDTWGPIGCMDCDNEEGISLRCFAVKGDLEPRTLEEERMLFNAVKEFSKIPGLDEDDTGGMFLEDYFIVDIPTCGKCGSHNIFSDF